MEEGNYTSLVEVMGHLLAVKERQNATDTMFEPLQYTIALLKVYEQELPDVVYKQLEVNCRSSTSHSFPQPIFSQLRQTHYFIFVSYNCPSSLYSPAAGNSSSATPVFPLSIHLPISTSNFLSDCHSTGVAREMEQCAEAGCSSQTEGSTTAGD